MRLQFTGISFLLALAFYCPAFAQRSAAEYFEDGNTKAGTGDFNGAMQAYTTVISMNPDHAPSYFNRGLAKANLKDYRGAMGDYDRAIELNPKEALYYQSRGVSKSLQDDYRSAIDDYSKAIELNPTTLQTVGEATMLVNGGVDLSKQPVWIEGPHLLHGADVAELARAGAIRVPRPGTPPAG